MTRDSIVAVPSCHPHLLTSPLRLFCSTVPSPLLEQVMLGHELFCFCLSLSHGCQHQNAMNCFVISLKNLFFLPGHSPQNQSLSRTGTGLMSNTLIPAITAAERNAQHERFVTPTTAAIILYRALNMACRMLTSLCPYIRDGDSLLGVY